MYYFLSPVTKKDLSFPQKRFFCSHILFFVYCHKKRFIFPLKKILLWSHIIFCPVSQRKIFIVIQKDFFAVTYVFFIPESQGCLGSIFWKISMTFCQLSDHHQGLFQSIQAHIIHHNHFLGFQGSLSSCQSLPMKLFYIYMFLFNVLNRMSQHRAYIRHAERYLAVPLQELCCLHPELGYPASLPLYLSLTLKAQLQQLCSLHPELGYPVSLPLWGSLILNVGLQELSSRYLELGFSRFSAPVKNCVPCMQKNFDLQLLSLQVFQSKAQVKGQYARDKFEIVCIGRLD